MPSDCSTKWPPSHSYWPTASCIAGVDCGFGTFARRLQVDSKIVWTKLASLAEGARLAS
jgi:hypothetical protein